MNIWYKGPVIERHIREYSPTLPKDAYQIDLFLHHGDGLVSKNDSPDIVVSKLLDLKQKIENYLQIPPKDASDQKYRKRLRLVNKIAGMCQKQKWFGKIIYQDIPQLIDTNEIGWKMTRKDYIF